VTICKKYDRLVGKKYGTPHLIVSEDHNGKKFIEEGVNQDPVNCGRDYIGS
jgi:hypothetical protein